MSIMKKQPINAASARESILYVTHRHVKYAIPMTVADKFVVETKKSKKPVKTPATIQSLFDKLNKKFTKAGALLKGLRSKEGLSQIAFAKKISLTQANLSSMENGRRPIGKTIAKRIEKVFGTDYRYFL